MGWFSNFIFGKPKTDDLADQAVRPVEEERQNSAQTSQPPQVQQDPFRALSGVKIVPEVVISGVNPRPSGDTKRLELWVKLRNESTFAVEVKRLEALGQTTEPGQFLRPGESSELKVYSGDTPRTDVQNKASIQYKIAGNGDYFQSDHAISYRLEVTDGIQYFLPCEMRLLPPVRDI